MCFQSPDKFRDVLQQLDNETLSQTYRVLSLAVSDVDDKNLSSRKTKSYNYVCSSLIYLINLAVLVQSKQQLKISINEVTVSSLNRDFVVAIPGLLGKIINYACSLPCNIIFIQK